MTGFLNAYSLTKEEKYVDEFFRVADWVLEKQIDSEYGEWYAQIQADGTSIGVKAGLWKTPYHILRACVDVVHRIEGLTKSS